LFILNPALDLDQPASSHIEEHFHEDIAIALQIVKFPGTLGMQPHLHENGRTAVKPRRKSKLARRLFGLRSGPDYSAERWYIESSTSLSADHSGGRLGTDDGVDG
jgi:hypothetical protein